MILHAWMSPDTCWEVLVCHIILWSVMHIDVVFFAIVFQQKHIGYVVCCVLTETFTTDCPKWDGCDNNPQRSFWNRASTAVSAASDHHTWFWQFLTWSVIQKNKQKKRPQKQKHPNKSVMTMSIFSVRKEMWEECLHRPGFCINEALWCFYGSTLCTSLLGGDPHVPSQRACSPWVHIQNKNTIEKEGRSTYMPQQYLHSFLFAYITFTLAVCRCCLRWCDSNAQRLYRDPVSSREVRRLTHF